jgi:hypothetical protein
LEKENTKRNIADPESTHFPPELSAPNRGVQDRKLLFLIVNVLRTDQPLKSRKHEIRMLFMVTE